MNEIPVNPAAGVRLRALFTDCAGTALSPSDVSAATYTVWVLNTWAGTKAAVQNHNNVTIPLTSFLASVTEDPETEKDYNFSYEISAITSPPFPANNAHYVIEVIAKDLNGEPHAEFIPCFSTMG